MPTPPSDPADPGYWPDAHPSCSWQGNTYGSPSGYGWHCEQMPPEPWPYSTDIPPEHLGPQWTVYRFPLDDLAARLTHGISQVGEQAARIAAKEFKVPWFPVGLGAVEWTVLDPREVPMTIDLWRVSIHGKIGNAEECVNVLHYRDKGPGPGHTQDAGGALMVAAQIAGHWSDFIVNAEGVIAAGPLNGILSPELQWDEVRCAKISQAAATSRPPVPPEKHTVWTQPKPTYVVDTQYSPFSFPGLVRGLGAKSLPYEVALCLSLGTGVRGGRNRGRLYLGPLATDLMATTGGGLFQRGSVDGVADSFHRHLVNRPAADALPLELVVGSMRYASARPVTEVKVGVVPDSQRRRRRNIPEDYHVE